MYALERLIVRHEQRVPLRVPSRNPRNPRQTVLTILAHEFRPMHHRPDLAGILRAIIRCPIDVLPEAHSLSYAFTDAQDSSVSRVCVQFDPCS